MTSLSPAALKSIRVHYARVLSQRHACLLSRHMRRPNAINLLSIVSRHKIPEFCHFKLFFCIRRQKNVRNLLGAYRIIVSLFSDDLVAVFGRRGSLSSLINGNENTKCKHTTFSNARARTRINSLLSLF